jgi:hypothetical protein
VPSDAEVSGLFTSPIRLVGAAGAPDRVYRGHAHAGTL